MQGYETLRVPFGNIICVNVSRCQDAARSFIVIELSKMAILGEIPLTPPRDPQPMTLAFELDDEDHKTGPHHHSLEITVCRKMRLGVPNPCGLLQAVANGSRRSERPTRKLILGFG